MIQALLTKLVSMTFDRKVNKVKLKVKNKNAWEFFPTSRVPKYYSVSSQVVCLLVASFSKIWLEWLNKPVIHNKKTFVDLLDRENKAQGFITVSNHYSCMDDPLIWGMRRWPQLLASRRWIPSAEEICFASKFTRLFFALGRCVPVVRGDGVYQKGMDFCLNELNKGEWIHVFPEGGINLTKEYTRLKWGVGRLIADCENVPVVLPVFHVGMDDILPNKKPYIPKIGQNVTVLVGEPLDYTTDLNTLRNLNKSPTEIRKHITDKIQEELWNLKVEAERLHLNSSSETHS